jgi:predicted Zn-dependent protease
VTIRGNLVLGATLALLACAVNPVTGERELALISPAEEVAIGRAQYAPSQQMQGGALVSDPRLNAYVASVGQRLATVSDRALPYEFVVLNNSVPNAWALPGGKLAINRGLLLELDSEAELAAVLGHEIVHAAAGHGRQAMQRNLILQGALLATTVAAQRSDYSSLAVGAASVGAQLINQRYSRDAELEADEYGMRYLSAAGYDPQAAVALQETFVRLSEGRSQGWLAGLFASHPPSAERVERNRATASSLPAAGELGQDRYQAALAGLERNRPAYEAYDQGRTALIEERFDDARRLADQAIRLFPAEPHFHALRGDVDFARDLQSSAIGYYAAAIERSAEFFYYHLQKGLAHAAIGQDDLAETELQTSVDLLPTADAYYGLGRLSEARGDRAGALERYGAAAGSSGSTGRAAQDAMARLELPENPGKYLQLRTTLDAQGQLLIDVGNPTRVTVTDVGLVVRYVDEQGAIRQISRVLTDTLATGAVLRLATGLGPFTSANAYQVAFQSARVVTDAALR